MDNKLIEELRLTDLERLVALTPLETRALSGEDVRWDKVSEVVATAQLEAIEQKGYTLVKVDEGLRERISEVIQAYHYEVVRVHNKNPNFKREDELQSLQKHADQILSLLKGEAIG